MELREFFKIFVINKKIFLSIIGLSIFFGILFYFIQPQVYKTSLILNITRDYSVPSKDYSYDNFYRLQADEKFVETVVKWIKSPYIIEATLKDISFDSNKNFEAKKLSSQVIEVSFVTITRKEAGLISKNLIDVLNVESNKLNLKQARDNWFIILGSKPIIKNDTKSLLFLVSLGFFIGFFIGFWVVMIKHYMIGSDK